MGKNRHGWSGSTKAKDNSIYGNRLGPTQKTNNCNEKVKIKINKIELLKACIYP